jgi:hypothetical protein
MESEYGVEFAERIETAFECPEGHTVIVPFAADADLPTVWGCRCGAEAFAVDCPDARPTQVKRPRTHWEMLLERRTIDELEDLLAERLELLRGSRTRIGRTG